MLARVLLHVVEAALPVETQIRGARRDRRREHVADRAILLLHVEDGDAVQRAAVGGLAAALGVEDRVLEDGEGLPGLHSGFDDGRRERRAIRLALECREAFLPHSQRLPSSAAAAAARRSNASPWNGPF